jgi:hypothetical protein
VSRQSGQSHDPPLYLEVIPYNLLGQFEPLDCAANANAVPEGDSSVSSDHRGDSLTPVKLLTRLRKKMHAEFCESRRLESRGEGENPDFSYTRAEQARRGVLAFGTAYRRRIRRQQLRRQMAIASLLIFEEMAICDIYQRVVITRVRVTNGAADLRPELGKQMKSCSHIVQLVYMNRYRHNLSNLLVPRSGTDTSSTHAINLMPDLHRNMFSPRSLGFPQEEKELTDYTNQPLFDYWDEVVGPRSLDPFDMALINSDTDGEGNVESFGDFKSPKKPPSQENGFVQTSFRPVEQLPCVVIDQDQAKPQIRIIRTRQKGISFDILMPALPDDDAAPTIAAPRQVSSLIPSIATRTLAITGVLQNATETSNGIPQTDRGHEEIFSLAGVLRCLRIRHEESRDIELAEARQYFDPFFLGQVLSSPPILMRLDRHQQGPLREDITALSNATGTGLAATSIRNLEVFYGPNLRETYSLASQLDGQVVNLDDRRLVRLRELLLRSATAGEAATPSPVPGRSQGQAETETPTRIDAGLEDLAARGASQVELDLAAETFQAIEREMAEEEAEEGQESGTDEVTDEIHGLRLEDDEEDESSEDDDHSSDEDNDSEDE